MKRKSILFILSAGLLLSAGCSTDDIVRETPTVDPETSSVDPETPTEELVDMVFRAGHATNTRTVMDGDGTVRWELTDCICVNGTASTAAPVITGSDLYANFKVSMSQATEYHAFYPSSMFSTSSSYSNGEYTITLPNEQQWKDNDSFNSRVNPTVAYSTNTDLSFYNVCGILKFTVQKVTGTSNINNVGILRITTADGKYISGMATVSPKDKTLVITPERGLKHLDITFATEKTINDNAITIYAVLPVGTYSSGCKIQLYHKTNDTKLLAEATINRDIDIQRSRIDDLGIVYMLPTSDRRWDAAPGNFYITLEGAPGADDSMLALTKTDSYPNDPNWLYFKFGSVVGIRAESDGASFDSDDADSADRDVVFNPTYDKANGVPYRITAWGNSQRNETEVSKGFVPSYSADDYGKYTQNNNADYLNVSGDKYHTVENLRIGKGDPCKLVGYKLSDIRTMLKYNQLPDNKTYRLPEKGENETFASNYTPSDRGLTLSGVFLPEAGGRKFDDGTVGFQESFGYYWSSTVCDIKLGHILYFSSGGVYPQVDFFNFSHGFSVRCVSPQQAPIQQP